MSSLIRRLAQRGVARANGTDPDAPAVHDPSLGQPLAGAIRPFMPGLGSDMLKDILDRKDKDPQLSRIGGGGYTHVSTLTNGVCARQAVLAKRLNQQTWEPVTGGHRLMWRYGRAAEAHIREQLCDGERQRFQIYGDWKCACKRTRHVGARPANMTCTTCRLPVDRYYEAPFFDAEHGVAGNPDLSLLLGRYYLPAEIKSMTNEPDARGRKQWDSLAAPLTEHVHQALFYRWLAQRNGFMVHDQVIIIYAAKAFRWGSPYKEFHVDVTTPPYERALAQMLGVALDIKRGTDAEANFTPERLPVCTTLDTSRAKGCPACASCFNLG